MRENYFPSLQIFPAFVVAQRQVVVGTLQHAYLARSLFVFPRVQLPTNNVIDVHYILHMH
jgi:hypothetical protein